MRALSVPVVVMLSLARAAVPLSSVAIAGLMCAPVYGQWVKVPAGGIPKGPDGKPNLSAPAPRSAEGHPDLSGVWESGSAKYILDIAADLKPGDLPFQPWAKALVDQRADGSHSGEDPPANCLPRGVPRINASPPPWRVIQKSDIIGILYESDNAWRQIFLDGRELGNDFLPTYLGYSTGKWDGDTLVVDTRGFKGRHGWIRRANPRRMLYTSLNVFGGRISGIWKFKLQSTTQRFIPSRGKSRNRCA